MNNKELPHDLIAEKSVLGSMFLSKYALQRSVESLSPEQFFSDANSNIFKVLSDLCDKGTPVVYIQNYFSNYSK